MADNAIITEDDLAAAFAEIEADQDSFEQIPSLDDGSATAGQVIGVTIPADEAARATVPDADDAAFMSDGFVDDEFLAEATEAAGPSKRAKRSIRERALGWLRRDKAADGPRSPWWAPVYDTIDWTLRQVNRPFSDLTSDVRRYIVLGSTVTILLAVLVIVLAPLLIRGKTPTEFLSEKRQELLRGAPTLEGP